MVLLKIAPAGLLVTVEPSPYTVVILPSGLVILLMAIGPGKTGLVEAGIPPELLGVLPPASVVDAVPPVSVDAGAAAAVV